MEPLLGSLKGSLFSIYKNVSKMHFLDFEKQRTSVYLTNIMWDVFGSRYTVKVWLRVHWKDTVICEISIELMVDKIIAWKTSVCKPLEPVTTLGYMAQEN